MNDNALYIRCPTCRTVFRTQDWTLELQAGKVRCGQCRMVFNGRSNLVEVAFDDVATDTETSPSPSSEVGHESDEVTSGIARNLAREIDEHAARFGREPPSHLDGAIATSSGELDSSDDTGPPSTSRPAPDTARAPFPEIGIDHDPLGFEAMPKIRGADTISGLETASDTGPPTKSPLGQWKGVAGEPLASDAHARYGPTTRSALALAPSPVDPVLGHDAVVMPAWKTPALPPRRAARVLYSVLSVLLVVGLVAQALFHYRNVIAADYPVTRHNLAAACTAIGCRIEPLKNRDEIVIESHDLQADPAHQGLLILQTTLRNQSRHALAFPHLELELDDDTDKPIVRRVFTPIDYAGGAADFSLGIPANSEWNIKLFLDASSVTAGAYHLNYFYP